MVNKVVLVGRVGKDPDIRYFDSNVANATFSLATSEFYKDKKGETVRTTEWHNIVLWRNQALLAEKYIRKGSLIYLEGRIRSRSYDDKEGNKRYITEILGDVIQLLDKRPDGESDGSFSPREASESREKPVQQQGGFNDAPDAASQEGPDDLPF
ncbi:MAG: single-stranded DNA-binding protein [Bacteroidales bacterium]